MDLANEEAILNYIFDPNKTFIASSQLGVYRPSGPSEEVKEAAKELSEEDLVRERDAVRMAEGGKVEEALAVMNEICTLYPDHAAGFNNRAQVFRMKEDEDKALSDLNTSVTIAEARYPSGVPAYGSIEDKLERYKVKRDTEVLSQALCQRALVYRKKGEEERSKEDFERAAQLGSGVATKMRAMHNNFYATICHRAVEEAMASEIPGYKEAKYQVPY
mmetsp:Transcript_44856/g.116310  ORF Transcript_44856/g.116310 Transcript_44856/m.116310 type:complete len:218 (-) Transcript_44856:455-1108(-)|eukprot:CAMPEP_0113891140 /NCGR_PEP_ID=MMETSP0780_2-20120614/14576_1 /TAXON_ID=652834 /ORGANISM="Palpitomonas bilix" /LENGTH=217 /DNA_ID=CAMNT_0000880695 /DNA_START=176 /DNA_END=829 /DNA_ORIENTATION=- /assembly_acc=CAM_ASM_000599